MAARLGFTSRAPLAVTYAGGVNVVPRLAAALVALLKLIRKSRRIALLLDAEDRNPRERVGEILREASRRGIKTSNPEPVPGCRNVYRFKANGVEVYAAVSGLPGLARFRKCG